MGDRNRHDEFHPTCEKRERILLAEIDQLRHDLNNARQAATTAVEVATSVRTENARLREALERIVRCSGDEINPDADIAREALNQEVKP